MAAGSAKELKLVIDTIKATLGARYSKTAGITKGDYEKALRAICGESTNEEAAAGGFKGQWSTDVRDEVLAELRRLQNATGFKSKLVTRRNNDTITFIGPTDLTGPGAGEGAGTDTAALLHQIATLVGTVNSLAGDIATMKAAAAGGGSNVDIISSGSDSKRMRDDSSSGEADDDSAAAKKPKADDAEADDKAGDTGAGEHVDLVNNFLGEIFPGGTGDQPASKMATNAAAALVDPPAPTITCEQAKLKVLQFVQKANAQAAAATTGGTAATIKKKAVTDLLDTMDQMSTAELATMAGGSEWMAQLAPGTHKSDGVLTPIVTDLCPAFAAEPNRKVAPGGFLHPYDFLAPKSDTADEVIRSVTGRAGRTTLEFDEGTGTISKSGLTVKFEGVDSFADIQACANRFSNYARRYSGARRVRHLHTDQHFLGFDRYKEKLLRWSKRFNINALVKFDVKFHALVFSTGHEYPNPWLMPTDGLFSEVFLEAEDAHLCASGSGGGDSGADSTNQRRLTNVNPDKKKPPMQQLHNKTKDGKEICRNWNNGLTCKAKDKCQHAHVCRICLKSHQMKDCPDKKKS